MKKIIFLSTIILIGLAVSGCSQPKPQPPTKSEANLISASIDNYNRNLITAQEKLETQLTKEDTTSSQFKKDADYISSLQRDKIKLKNTLLVLKIVQMTKAGQQATVQTEEVWRVAEEKYNGQKKDNGELYYQVTYKLLHKKNKWLIDSVDTDQLQANNQPTQQQNSPSVDKKP